jgi:peroxiredoxin Q/BCP
MLPIDFTLTTDTGDLLSLSSLRGRRVVLYFYPKDDTSGCTLESCEFRDLFPRFQSSDAVILGISPDDAKSHQKFKKKYALPFTLLVDANHALAERLGIWVEKTFYGRKYMGVQRTTYIIGSDGTVQHVFEKVNPAGHADEVMAFLRGGLEAALRSRAAHTAANPAPDAAAKPPAKPPAKRGARKTTSARAKKPTGKKAKAPAKAPAKKPAKKPARKPAKTPRPKTKSRTPARKK